MNNYNFLPGCRPNLQKVSQCFLVQNKYDFSVIIKLCSTLSRTFRLKKYSILCVTNINFYAPIQREHKSTNRRK